MPQTACLIDAVWETTAHATGTDTVRVLPDGCVDLVWHDDCLVVAGPDRVARLARVRPGGTSCGVRFLPGSARPVFGLPGQELGSGSTPAAEILGEREAERISAALSASAPEGRPDLLRRWAGHRLHIGGLRDPVAGHVSDLLTRDPTLKVSELAGHVGYSERQLRRRLHSEVGYGPKLLARILRLQRTLAIARTDRSLSLADAAFVGGFVDQAHLTHECSALAGTTPAELLEN